MLSQGYTGLLESLNQSFWNVIFPFIRFCMLQSTHRFKVHVVALDCFVIYSLLHINTCSIFKCDQTSVARVIMMHTFLCQIHLRD
jgi:hypothetical protein